MAARTPRIFLDSSVLLAAAISHRGAARDLIRAGIRGISHRSLSTLVVQETERNIIAKAPHGLDMFA